MFVFDSLDHLEIQVFLVMLVPLVYLVLLAQEARLELLDLMVMMGWQVNLGHKDHLVQLCLDLGCMQSIHLAERVQLEHKKQLFLCLP